MHKLVLDLADRDLEISRAHRLPKPPHFSAEYPRDVLARIHFYNAKEKAMLDVKHATNLPEPFTAITLYVKLSKATMENC